LIKVIAHYGIPLRDRSAAFTFCKLEACVVGDNLAASSEAALASDTFTPDGATGDGDEGIVWSCAWEVGAVLEVAPVGVWRWKVDNCEEVAGVELSVDEVSWVDKVRTLENADSSHFLWLESSGLGSVLREAYEAEAGVALPSEEGGISVSRVEWSVNEVAWMWVFADGVDGCDRETSL
jgi:hypothetical protein